MTDGVGGGLRPSFIDKLTAPRGPDCPPSTHLFPLFLEEQRNDSLCCHLSGDGGPSLGVCVLSGLSEMTGLDVVWTTTTKHTHTHSDTGRLIWWFLSCSDLCGFHQTERLLLSAVKTVTCTLSLVHSHMVLWKNGGLVFCLQQWILQGTICGVPVGSETAVGVLQELQVCLGSSTGFKAFLKGSRTTRGLLLFL